MGKEEKDNVRFRLLMEEAGLVAVFITFLCGLAVLSDWGGKVMVPIALALMIATVLYIVVVHWIFHFYRPLEGEEEERLQLYRKGFFFWVKIAMLILAFTALVLSLLNFWFVGCLLFSIGGLLSIGNLVLVVVLHPEELQKEA